MSPDDLAERIRTRLPDVAVGAGDVVAGVPADRLLDTLDWLRGEPDLALDFLADLTATDWPDRDPRFWVAYELLSLEHHHRVRLRVGLPSEDPTVPSVTPMFPTANWHERETFDFFGIRFEGHPDLVRILMPDDWEGHPLRKTEALGGVETRYHGAFIPPVDQRTTT